MATSGIFTGKTVVITGAGSGIGRATALRIAAEGAHVIAADLDPIRLATLAADLDPQHPASPTTDLDPQQPASPATEQVRGRVSTVAGDLTDPAVLEQIMAAAGGRVDALANVAGIMDGFLPPAEVDDETWERVLGLNLTAVMRLTRAVLPGMLAAGDGAIVNVASEAALRPSAAGAAYTTSKHAVVGYTKSVAFFYGHQGIRANVVAPGPTITNIEGAIRSEHAARRAGPVMQATMPAPVQPDRVAAVIAWLLGPESSNVNGALIPSDGGWSVA